MSSENRPIISYKENIRNWVLNKVQNKEWIVGDKIPSITQIATRFNVSRETVRLSLENLVRRGVLQPKQGKGYFIAPKKEINLRVSLLCKIDGVYLKPIYQGLIGEAGGDISIQVNEIRQSEKALVALMEDLISRQAIDWLFIIPVVGEEEKINKILAPYKRRVKIGWIDKAPADVSDPVFLCDYKKGVEIAVEYMKNNDIENIYYFSRNQEDNSIFSLMRNTFREAVDAGNGNNSTVISDWLHILSIIKNSTGHVGIMAETDYEGIFLLSRLKSNGIRIPQQVSIISCDNTDITDLVTPTLSAVDPGFIDVGRRARMWITGETDNLTSVYYTSPFLVKKESCI